MEKLTLVIERELTKLIFGYISLKTAKKRIIKAVKERDAFIIGKDSEISQEYICGHDISKIKDQLKKTQRQRAEESR